MKSTLIKLLLWLTTAYAIGYFSGAIIASIVFEFHPLVLYFGLMVSLQFAGLYGAPAFIILVILYLLLNKKIKVDTSWVASIVLSGSIATASTIAMRIMESKTSTGVGPYFAETMIIFFFGGWLGTLLPRMIFKRLKPGSFK